MNDITGSHAAAGQDTWPIQHIDIINLSHYDIGFTDHPAICRQLQARYLDAALQLVSRNAELPPAERFFWTCESNLALLDWWEAARSPARDRFLEAVAAGWIEVCALPFNHCPTMDAAGWRTAVHWLPDALWEAVRPRVAMQNDVNGFPRAGALALLDRGVEFLWMAINSDTGGPPMPQPSAFWWEMPDGRRIFVWNSITYPSGYSLFEREEWRHGPLPGAADARYRPPQPGDFFDPSPEGLARSHARCLARLAEWEHAAGGRPYRLSRVAVSMTNMWRIDNDPPCALLPGLVAAWTRAGLQPSLIFTTPTPALTALREAAGASAPVLAGEWTDWWANGAASAPHELAASRRAKRYVAALESPLYPHSESRAAVAGRCRRELALYDEHTYGSWNSAALPDGLDSRGQNAEKAILAFRPLVFAELGLGDANRQALHVESRGEAGPRVHAVNPHDAPYEGWVELTDDCLRGSYAGVIDETTATARPFDVLPGPKPFYVVPESPNQFSPFDTGRVFPDAIPGKRLRFWTGEIPAHAARSFQLVERLPPAARLPAAARDPSAAAMTVTQGATGWPRAATCRRGDEEVALFEAELGDFISLEFGGLGPRWTYKSVLAAQDRAAARDRGASFIEAVPEGPASVRDTGPTVVYEQHLRHPRLRWLFRRLELYKAVPRGRLAVSFYRTSRPESAEIFYLRFPLPCRGWEVAVANGGVSYRPAHDVLPGACLDFFPVDGDVIYALGDRRVTLAMYDNALVSLGGMHDGLRLPALPADLSTVYPILYNNIWYTNFPGDQSGTMSFTFDLYAGGPETRWAPDAYPVVQV